jgi:hypothetical protein
MKHPVKPVFDVTVKMSANKTVFRWKHVMIIRFAGTGGVEKTKITFHMKLTE